MPRRRPSNPEPAPIGEANVLPVMNIMFLLIPALLLAMEVASMAAVAISPPKTTVAPSDHEQPSDTAELDLKVTILADGFAVSYAGQQAGVEAGQAQEHSSPSIPLARPDAALDDYDRYDYRALETLAQDLGQAHPEQSVVTVSAESDIPAQVLVETLDALRGYGCKLGQLEPGEAVPETCLFFRPVVEAGAG